jgi:hypothetical protein
MDESNVIMPQQAGIRSSADVALDLMKFVAQTSGYGRMPAGAGFSGKPGARSYEEYAESLLQLYERCREIVEKKK